MIYLVLLDIYMYILSLDIGYVYSSTLFRVDGKNRRDWLLEWSSKMRRRRRGWVHYGFSRVDIPAAASSGVADSMG